MSRAHGLTAILPCNDLDASEAFYARLGFTRRDGEDVDALATRMGCRAENKPWGMYEFAVSDHDETLVRVGWPSRNRPKTASWVGPGSES